MRGLLPLTAHCCGLCDHWRCCVRLRCAHCTTSPLSGDQENCEVYHSSGNQEAPPSSQFLSERGDFDERERRSYRAAPVLRCYLFIGEALVSEDLQQRGSIAVPALEHLSNNAEQVPDTLRLSAPQRAQQTCPFSSGRRFRGRQIHRVYITVKGTENMRRRRR